MRTAGVILALVIALVLQSTLAGITIEGAGAVNLVLVVVIYVALAFGPVTGLLAGTAGGLVQDALAGGVIGIGGLCKTLVGFLVGVLGAQFIVAQALPRMVMFVAATLLHEVCYRGLYGIVGGQGFRMDYSMLLTQAAVNAVVGVLAFQVVESGPGLLQRRRARMSRRRY